MKEYAIIKSCPYLVKEINTQNSYLVFKGDYYYSYFYVEQSLKDEIIFVSLERAEFLIFKSDEIDLNKRFSYTNNIPYIIDDVITSGIVGRYYIIIKEENKIQIK